MARKLVVGLILSSMVFGATQLFSHEQWWSTNYSSCDVNDDGDSYTINAPRFWASPWNENIPLACLWRSASSFCHMYGFWDAVGTPHCNQMTSEFSHLAQIDAAGNFYRYIEPTMGEIPPPQPQEEMVSYITCRNPFSYTVLHSCRVR